MSHAPEQFDIWPFPCLTHPCNSISRNSRASRTHTARYLAIPLYYTPVQFDIWLFPYLTHPCNSISGHSCVLHNRAFRYLAIPVSYTPVQFDIWPFSNLTHTSNSISDHSHVLRTRAIRYLAIPCLSHRYHTISCHSRLLHIRTIRYQVNSVSHAQVQFAIWISSHFRVLRKHASRYTSMVTRVFMTVPTSYAIRFTKYNLIFCSTIAIITK